MGDVKADEFAFRLHVVVHGQLVAGGVEQALAAQLAGSIVDSIQRTFGGSQIYIPKGRHKTEERVARVFSLRRAGATTAEIAAGLGVSVRWVQMLLAANG